MLSLIIFVPVLIISILLWTYDYIKCYQKPKKEAEKNNDYWRYDNYFDYLYYNNWSWKNVLACGFAMIAIFALCLTIFIIATERSDNRVEYETAIIMRESYVSLAENKSLAYTKAVNFNETVAENRSAQDNFLKDIYYPNDCDWNNIELIDINETLKEEDTLFEGLFD